MSTLQWVANTDLLPFSLMKIFISVMLLRCQLFVFNVCILGRIFSSFFSKSVTFHAGTHGCMLAISLTGWVSDLQWRCHRFKFQSQCGCIVSLGKLFTPLCPCHSSVIWYHTKGSDVGGLSPPKKTLDHGQNFLQNRISTWHLLYTVIHNHLQICYLHYPSGMLEDWIHWNVPASIACRLQS